MKKHIQPYTDKKQAHGLWIWYLSNGKLCYKGQYVNNIRYGYFIDNLNKKQKITFFLT